MNTFRQTDIKRSYECWFTLDFHKLMAKNVKFWQIPWLFRGNLQIPRKIVNSAESTKIRDFLRDHESRNSGGPAKCSTRVATHLLGWLAGCVKRPIDSKVI